MARTLNEDETRALIASGGLGRLGCVVDNEPYVVPINYVFDGEAIYGHSEPGQKISALRMNPRACLQVDQIEDEFRWRSAIAFGRFEEIESPTERLQVLHKLITRFPLLTPVESVNGNSGDSRRVTIFRIRIDRVTGVAED